MKNKGKINVKTENIFPVIKKFLYSEHDIFLRELVSNAMDATTKVKALSVKENIDLGDLTIDIKVDKDKKELHIIDRGIGMTAEEVEKYINQIAFSSAEEFVEKYKEVETGNIIGHFGLGFYSAFMVSDNVEIITKSYQDAPAVHWTCDGSPNYSLNECDKTERGTEIILHLSEDALEFADESKILELLKKYCRFLPFPIRFGTEKIWEKPEGAEKEIEVEKERIINNTNPLWKQSPTNITEEDYKKFYHELYPMSFEDPLFNIHLNVDYPFNLTGILYFPKVSNQFELQKNKIQLYCNQVYITDQLEGIVPEFLMLLHGVIDSPDIPLNVSRSYLQSDSNVKKISTHITKKVADKLEELFKNDREKFENLWDNIKVFIQYGCITDEKFYERAKNFFLLKNTENKYFTLEEYKTHIETLQKDKNDTLIYLYTSDKNSQYTYIQSCKDKGYDVLIMDGFLESHFINTLEQKLEKSRFVRVDSDIIDKLIEKSELIPCKLSEKEQNELKAIYNKAIDPEKFTVSVESMDSNDVPVLITQNEFMRRWKDMQKLSNQPSFMGDRENFNLVINGNHEFAQKILTETDEVKKENFVKQLTDLALLSQNMLVGEELNKFVKRSIELL